MQPLAPHDHWHVDFSYMNIGGTFYYLCSVLDGYSRSIVAWDVRTSMKRRRRDRSATRPRSSGCRPALSLTGPQFVARDFKEFIRLWHDLACADLALLPAKQRETGALSPHLEKAAIRPETPLA